MNSATVGIEVELKIEECITAGCGVVWAVTAGFQRLRRKDHQPYYCPNGHGQHWAAKSEEEKLRAELASARGNEAYYRERAELERVAAETARRSAAAQRGVKTRILNQVKAGVCPFCSRRFDSLGIHVRAEHGDEVAKELAAE